MNLRIAFLFSVVLGIVTAPLSANENESSRSSAADSIPHNRIMKISSEIDRLVMKKLSEHDQVLNPLASDEVFLRRAYLNIVGRIPTLEETKRFLNSKGASRRASLIDELLDSYGHVSHEFNFWADLLRIKTRHQNTIGQPYIDYVKDSLAENKPYDQLVRELVASEGPMMSRENGAVGYYLRDRNMPEDNMSNTIRVFLGTRLECAQCHDHPFDDWTQRQYFEMVAFTGGLMTRLNVPDSVDPKGLQKLRKSNALKNDSVRATMRRLIEPMTFGVAGTGTGLARLPENFLGSDGEEFEIVTAKTMFEGKPLIEITVPSGRKVAQVNKRRPQQINGAQQIDSRMAYADWLTSSENPRFAKVMANRLWKRAMGIGLIEPVDDLTKHTVASNPELLDYLTDVFIELDFDMKQLQRAILNSKTYQATAFGEDVADPNKYYFNGPVVRRMSAEQIWDSLLTLTIPEVDQRLDVTRHRFRGFGVGEIYSTYDQIRNMSADELLKIAQGGKESSMMMMAQQNDRKAQKQLQKQKDALSKKIKEARKRGNRSQLDKLNKEKERLTAEIRKSARGADQMNRASEIRSPAAPGHFLREFGQSDRETIENSNRDPAVTQALSLMNGFLETRIVNNPHTELMSNLEQTRDAEVAVEIVFLTMLNREPNSKERMMWSRDIKKNQPMEIIGDLIWTLANTNEFIFIK